MADRQTNTGASQGTQSGGTQGREVSRGSQSGGLSRRSHDPFFSSPREFFSASPFSMMRRMAEEMDRMFSEFGGGGGQGAGTWAPPIEVSERGGNYVIHADLPGLKPEDVKVELTDEGLVIQGERKYEHEENKGGVHRSERRYGQFYRAIPLPEGVNPEQVKARFENGVLEVTAPVPQQQSNRRQIPIQGGAASSGGSSSASGGTGASSATSSGGSSGSTSGSTQR